MMLLGNLVNMLAIFAGCFVGVTLGRFIPERFNSAIEKGIALCVFYIGLDGVLAGSDTLVAILSMVLGVILGELLDLDGRIHALGDWVERRFAKKQSKTSISEGFVNASLLFCVGAMAIMGALDSGLTGDHATLYAKSTLDGITSIVYGSTMGAGVALSGVAVFLYQGLITLCAVSQRGRHRGDEVRRLAAHHRSELQYARHDEDQGDELCPRRVLPDFSLHLYVNSCKGTPPVDRRGFLILFCFGSAASRARALR